MVDLLSQDIGISASNRDHEQVELKDSSIHAHVHPLTAVHVSQMFDCKEDFRLADEDREAAVTSSTDRVRMAADEKELEASFTRAMGLLDEVGLPPKRRHSRGVKLHAQFLD